MAGINKQNSNTEKGLEDEVKARGLLSGMCICLYPFSVVTKVRYSFMLTYRYLVCL